MTLEFVKTYAQESPIFAAGSQTGATSGTVVFSNSNNVSFGMSGSSIITASASGIGPGALSFWNNVMGGGTSSFPTGLSVSMFPLNAQQPFPGKMTVSTMMMNMSCSSSQSTAAGTLTFSIGIYTLNASTLSLQNSVSTSVTWAAVSNNSTAFSGFRWLTFHSSQWSSQPVFTQTNYWMGLVLSTSSQTQGFNIVGAQVNWATVTNVGAFSGTVGVSNAPNYSTAQIYPFFGIVNTQGIPTSVTAALTGGGFSGTAVPHIIFNNVLGTF